MVKRYLWSTVDASNNLIPFVILEMDEFTAQELEDRRKRGQLWLFIANKLEGRRVGDIEFPSYFNEYGRRRLFWYNNVLEDYEDAYEDIIKKNIKRLKDYFDDEEALLIEVERIVKEKLSKLPVIKL
jgi:hypothetical protein